MDGKGDLVLKAVLVLQTADYTVLFVRASKSCKH